MRLALLCHTCIFVYLALRKPSFAPQRTKTTPYPYFRQHFLKSRRELAVVLHLACCTEVLQQGTSSHWTTEQQICLPPSQAPQFWRAFSSVGTADAITATRAARIHVVNCILFDLGVIFCVETSQVVSPILLHIYKNLYTLGTCGIQEQNNVCGSCIST